MNELIEIGYIQKPKGLKGEVFVVLYDRDSSFINKGDDLLLDKGESLTVKDFKSYKDSYLFIFEGVSDRNQSEALKGKKLFITKALAESLNTEDEIFLATLIGYEFFNHDQKIGTVSGFSTTKAHDLIQVSILEGDTVEIPWVKSFFDRVDHKNRSVFFQAPQELCDPDFLSAGKKS